MKQVLGDLKLGESLLGTVVELLPGDELLMSFSGDLVRVHNETKRELKVGERVTVVVTAVSPPRFRLPSERKDRRRRGGIDVTV